MQKISKQITTFIDQRRKGESFKKRALGLTEIKI